MGNFEPSSWCLDEDVDRQLRVISVDLGHGRSRSLCDLILGWGNHVNRLKSELAEDLASKSNVWNEHDYVASMFIRDFVDEGLSQLTGDLSVAAQACVTQIDSEFRSFTNGGHRMLLERVAEVDAKGRGWWWDRLPISGPVLDNITEHYK